MFVVAVTPLEPRITWFGPREADFSRGFKNRLLAFFGGVIPYNPEKTTLTSAVRAVRRVFEADGVLGIFAEGRIGFRESELLPFEDGAAAFAVSSGVPVLPCAIVGSTDLWFRKRIEVRFGPPIQTDAVRGREARSALEARIRESIGSATARERAAPAATPAARGPDEPPEWRGGHRAARERRPVASVRHAPDRLDTLRRVRRRRVPDDRRLLARRAGPVRPRRARPDRLVRGRHRLPDLDPALRLRRGTRTGRSR